MSQPVSALLATVSSELPSLEAVWRASELAQNQITTVGTGFDALDKELPSHGWPVGALTEILQNQQGLHEWRLLLPALRTCCLQGTVALVGSPHLPNLAALAGQGIAHRSILLIEANQPAERLWAAEQVLRCKEISALLVWLPQARSDQLRRLHLASANHANGKPRLVFAFRPQAAALESSAAPLRLILSQGLEHHLRIEIVKRKGPALDTPLLIAAQVPSLLTLRSGVPHRNLITQGSATAALTVDVSHAVDSTESPRRTRKHRPLALA
jgi:protein ImuA